MTLNVEMYNGRSVLELHKNKMRMSKIGQQKTTYNNGAEICNYPHQDRETLQLTSQ